MSSAKGSLVEESREEPPRSASCKGQIVTLFGAICSAVFGVDPTDSESLPTSPDSPLTDFDHDSWGNFSNWRVSSTILYQVTFLALLIYFIVTAYIAGRTESFISLDKKAGVCKDDSSSKYCCEVPQTVTGTFLADTKGRWNTQSNFSYITNNYAVTVAGLQYTNEQWTDVMKNITAQLQQIGSKGENRDYAWNMIAWSSFTAQNLDRGFLQFYSTGQANIMFDKPIVNSGVASAASQTQECNQPMSVSYSSATTNLDVSIKLCDDAEGGCDNPCPGVLAPQAMGYDLFNSEETNLDLTINLQAVSTALAVNMGMVPLNHLVMVPGDNSRLTLLDTMVSQGAIDAATASRTSSYFDSLRAPTPPIYCYSANVPVQNSNTWLSGNAFCMVRVGNTLVYPVATSYGWSQDGKSYPTQCTKSAAAVAGSAAKFYCNKFDMNIGLIYYPVPNQNASTVYTYAPSKTPTNRPTPPPGAPTLHPTTAPTVRPSRSPTANPTPPPGAPTALPTTQRPTRKPSASPTSARRLLRNGNKDDAESLSSRDRDVLAAGDPSVEPTAEPTESAYYGFDDYAGDDGGNYYSAPSDDGAADDAYATAGIGTYASPYYANSNTDDFSPLIPIVADNGLIFKFGKVAAAELNKAGSTNGDLFVPNNAYFAMVDTLIGPAATSGRGYSKDFNKLCSSSVDPSVAAGCAMIAFNLDGEDDRSISTYFYQPSSTPAYSNTLYIKNELIMLQKVTPTSLIQTYYSCVLAPWPALLNAVGVGASSATVFVMVGFAVYVFFILFLLNRYYGANIPSKKAMAKADRAAQELHDQEVQRMIAVVAALRADLDSGRVNLPHVSAAFRDTDEDIQKAQDASAKAAGRRPGRPGQSAPTAPEVEMNAVHKDNARSFA